MNQHTIHIVNNCITRIKAGDNYSAVEELYAVICNRVRFIALRYTKNDYDADDLVQDFWQNISNYCSKYRDGNGYFFLCKILSNNCIDWLKQKGKETSIISLEDIDHYESLSCEDATDRQLDMDELHRKATEKMTERERIVYAYIIYEGLSIRNTSRELGVSKSEVARLRKNALKKVEITMKEMNWDKNDL